MAVLIAVGVRSSGEREVVGVDVGRAEDHEFWLKFLRQLISRALSGVRLVISDSQIDLKQAVLDLEALPRSPPGLAWPQAGQQVGGGWPAW